MSRQKQRKTPVRRKPKSDDFLKIDTEVTSKAIQGLELFSQWNEIQEELNTSQKQNVDIIEWIRASRWIEGAPWSFEGLGPKIEIGDYDIIPKKLSRPYLFQFLRDNTSDRSAMKARQIEITENHINEALFYICTRPHTRVAHVFPTDDMGDGISNEKIIPAIKDSPLIKAKLSGVGAVRRLMFKNGSLYSITGANKKSGGRAASRDYVVFDEMDLIPESVFGVYERLMEHSALRIVRKISTPTTPGTGIDLEFDKGSGYIWHWTCIKCKKEQIFGWPENIINYFEVSDVEPDDPAYIKKLNKAYLGCQYCGEYVDRNSIHYIQSSRWVAKKPQLIGERSSYHMTGPMIAWKTGKELVRKFHVLSAYEWQFMNEIWGGAYLKGENRISEQEILACQRKWRMAKQRTFSMRNVVVGVDWGMDVSNLVVSCNGYDQEDKEMRCIVYIAEINKETLQAHGFSGDTLSHVDFTIKVANDFKADLIVTDGNGLGVDRAARLLKHFGKRNFAAFFDTAEMGRQLRSSKMMVPNWQESTHRVTFSKVLALKEKHSEFRTGRVGISAIVGPEAGVVRKFVKQNMNLAVQPRWNEEYQNEVEIVVKIGTADHFCDADFYSMTGWRKLVGISSKIPGIVLKRR